MKRTIKRFLKAVTHSTERSYSWCGRMVGGWIGPHARMLFFVVTCPLVLLVIFLHVVSDSPEEFDAWTDGVEERNMWK